MNRRKPHPFQPVVSPDPFGDSPICKTCRQNRIECALSQPAPMKRSKPLRRKTPLRAKGQTSYARRPRKRGYVATVRKLPCIVRAYAASQLRADLGGHLGPLPYTSCTGRVDPDHLGRRPFGHLADDDTTVPMCRKHHRERHGKRGTFKGFTKAMMRTFCDWAIARTQSEVAKLRFS